MARLNIDYQLLTWEGDILRLKFWARAFDVLKQTGAVYLQNEGRHAGCWVMKIDDDSASVGRGATKRIPKHARRSSSARTARSSTSARTWPTSSGSPACSATISSIARSRTRMDGAALWATTSDPSQAVDEHPTFGDAAATYNVIDVRQSYLQKLLKQALSAIGHPQEADRLTHFSYEMVALSHATAKELGFAPRSGFRGREEAVRRGVRPQGARREGRRSDRSRHREGARRSAIGGRASCPRRSAARSPNRSASPRCATS